MSYVPRILQNSNYFIAGLGDSSLVSRAYGTIVQNVAYFGSSSLVHSIGTLSSNNIIYATSNGIASVPVKPILKKCKFNGVEDVLEDGSPLPPCTVCSDGYVVPILSVPQPGYDLECWECLVTPDNDTYLHPKEERYGGAICVKCKDGIITKRTDICYSCDTSAYPLNWEQDPNDGSYYPVWGIYRGDPEDLCEPDTCFEGVCLDRRKCYTVGYFDQDAIVIGAGAFPFTSQDTPFFFEGCGDVKYNEAEDGVVFVPDPCKTCITVESELLNKTFSYCEDTSDYLLDIWDEIIDDGTAVEERCAKLKERMILEGLECLPECGCNDPDILNCLGSTPTPSSPSITPTPGGSTPTPSIPFM